MTIRVHLGSEEQGILLPPSIPALPNGLVGEVKSASATVDGAGAVSEWRLAFTSETEDTYAVPAVSIFAEDGPEEALFETDGFTVTVRTPMGELWLVLAAGLVAGGMTVAGIRRHRRKAQVEQVDPSATPVEQVQQRLHAARRHRLDGDFYEYYRCLSRAAALCGEGEPAVLSAKLEERARQVGYQGLRPSDDELDSVIRDVEKALRRFKEERAV